MSSQGKPLHLCVPVLNRYDLLRQMFLSLQHSTLQPTMVHIVDNGNGGAAMDAARSVLKVPSEVFTPRSPYGVAQAWNTFLAVPEERIITNDDVVFTPTSLEQLVAVPGDMVAALPGSAFSCFLIRDSLVQKVGTFDETISPGFAYFEDCDYEERMRLAGTMFVYAEVGVQHVHSATRAALSGPESQDFNRKFLIAQENFFAKWGRMPEGVVRQTAS